MSINKSGGSDSKLLDEMRQKEREDKEKKAALAPVIVDPIKDQKGFFYTLLLVVTTSQLMFLNISTFLPVYL